MNFHFFNKVNRRRSSTMWKLLMLIVLWVNVYPHCHKHFLLLLTNCVEAATQQQQQQQQQQPRFTHTTTTLSQGRAVLTSISLGELVFFAGGGTSPTTSSDRVDIYNVTSANWTTFTLSAPRGSFAATSSQNLVFFGGGTDSLQTKIVYDRIDIYNTLNGSWSTATLSQPRHSLAATSVGNLVLFGGGSNSTGPSNVVDVFDVTNNTWTTATLSQARTGLVATSVDNRYALFGGGYNGSVITEVVDIFDSLNGIWNTSTLSQARYILSATSLGNLAFFGGGNTTGNQPSKVVDIFNSTSQTWINSTLSQARIGLAASSVGEIVAFGGGTPDGFAASSVVDLFNLTSNIWFTVTLSQPRGFLASTSSNNKIFFGAGLGNTGLSNIVDIFDFNPQPLLPSSTSITSSFMSTTSIPSTNSTIDTTLSPSNPPFQNDSLMNATTDNLSISSPSNDGLSSGAIAGIVVGSVVVFFGMSVIVLIVFLKHKRKQQKKKQRTYSSLTPIEQNINTNNEKDTPTNDLRKSLGPLLTHSQISFNEIVVEKEIGEGSYGKVCLGRWNDAPVALKFCHKKANIDDFMSEIKIMIGLPPHPNVVQLFGVSLDGPQPVIIMEYCSGGGLDKLLFGNDENEKPTISLERKMELIQGIARGVLHLHKHNIIHRDLAARNILLSASGEPKITDFGMSRILEQREEGKTKSDIGPVCWMAPESIATRNYSKKSDVWTFGIVVYEIVAQCEPHKGVANLVELAISIRDEGLTPTIPEDCPPKLRELMEMCWKKDPDQRPTMETALAMLTSTRILGTG